MSGERTPPVELDDETKRLCGLACRFGALGAIVFDEFDRTTRDMCESDRRLLLAAWAATIDLAAGDAGLEVRAIRRAIMRLRDVLKERSK